MIYDLEIVTHCWAGSLPQYAELLKWQMASLCHWTPKAKVHYAVFTAFEDAATRQMYAQTMRHFPESITSHLYMLPRGSLFRRAIGRNKRCYESSAARFWFTDVDYAFGDGCLDSVVSQVPADGGLHHPRHVQIQHDHALGDQRVREHLDDSLPKLDAADFGPRRQKLCIGGVQIIGGDMARKIGYLKDTEWVRPVDASMGFRSCRCDKVWRSHNDLKSTPIEVNSCYRLRHTTDGRDYDVAGTYVGKDAW